MKKDIGVGLKAPETACDDPKCPWHGRLSVRGRVFEGIVKSTKSHNTAIIEMGYHRYVQKYQTYEKKRLRITAHNPPCVHARDGDHAIAAECRPLSKTKHFVVVSVKKAPSGAKAAKSKEGKK